MIICNMSPRSLYVIRNNTGGYYAGNFHFDGFDCPNWANDLKGAREFEDNKSARDRRKNPKFWGCWKEHELSIQRIRLPAESVSLDAIKVPTGDDAVSATTYGTCDA